MANDPDTVRYFCDQIRSGGVITARAMFGGHGVYCDGKIVALICYNQLFLKPTPGAAALLPMAEMAPPYEGAKDYILADAVLEDPALLGRVVAQIATETPAPKPKKRKP